MLIIANDLCKHFTRETQRPHCPRWKNRDSRYGWIYSYCPSKKPHGTLLSRSLTVAGIGRFAPPPALS